MTFKTEKLEFKNKDGITLAGRLELPESNPTTFAIFVHCFTCSKDVHAATRISRALTKSGIAVLRFDFTGIGNSDGDFSNTNFSTNVSDLVSAYNYMSHHHKTPELLIGHSLGGAAVLAAGTSMPAIKAIVTINAPSDTHHVENLFDHKIEQIENLGEAEVRLAGRSFIIKKQFIDDVRSIMLQKKIEKLKATLLIFHSSQDDIVSFEHAEKIFKAAKGPKNLLSLEGASHLLDKKEDSLYVSNVISSWSLRYLKHEKN